MLIGEALKMVRETLYPKYGDFAVPQSEEILLFFLKCSRSDLYLNSTKQIDPQIVPELKQILKRMLNNEPLGYILGTVFFYSREFEISRDVLIPRPDTETLVEEILSNEKKDTCRFVDAGIGSGIIACVLKESRPQWKAYGIDISYKALKIASKNCFNQVSLACCDLFSSFKPGRFFDFIVSNPPYISEKEYFSLDQSVRNHEPCHALYGGEDGLDFYRRLAVESKRILCNNGRIYCEIGFNQKNPVKEIFNECGWSDIIIKDDLGRNPRVIRAVLKDNR